MDERLTEQKVLGALADLRKKPASHRVSHVFHQLEDLPGDENTPDSDVRHEVHLTVFLLEDGASTTAFRTETYIKILSDPTPADHISETWRIGTLEDAARAVCDRL